MLVVDYVVIHDFCGSAADIIHPSNPFHLVVCLELFGHAFTLRHLFYVPKKHILSLFINVCKITVQLTACQQISVSHLVVLLDVP